MKGNINRKNEWDAVKFVQALYLIITLIPLLVTRDCYRLRNKSMSPARLKVVVSIASLLNWEAGTKYHSEWGLIPMDNKDTLTTVRPQKYPCYNGMTNRWKDEHTKAQWQSNASSQYSLVAFPKRDNQS